MSHLESKEASLQRLPPYQSEEKPKRYTRIFVRVSIAPSRSTNQNETEPLAPEVKEDSSWKERAITFPAAPVWTLGSAEQNVAGGSTGRTLAHCARAPLFPCPWHCPW